MKENIKAKALKSFMYNLEKIKAGTVFECDYNFFMQMYYIPTNDPMIDYAEKIEVVEVPIILENREDELVAKIENKEQKLTRKKK